MSHFMEESGQKEHQPFQAFNKFAGGLEEVAQAFGY